MVAFEMARKLSIDTVVCPSGGGVGSCIGLVTSPRLYEASVTNHGILAALSEGDITETFEQLHEEARQALATAGADEDDLVAEPSVDMRHIQQGYEIEVPLPVSDLDDISPDIAREQFRKQYQTKFSRDILDFPIEIINYHLTLRESTEDAEFLVGERGGTGDNIHPESREVYFDDRGHIEADVYQWETIQPGATFDGPAIVEADRTTAVVDPRSTVEVAQNKDLVITLEERQ